MIRLRFGLIDDRQHTLEEIGKIMGLTVREDSTDRKEDAEASASLGAEERRGFFCDFSRDDRSRGSKTHRRLVTTEWSRMLEAAHGIAWIPPPKVVTGLASLRLEEEQIRLARGDRGERLDPVRWAFGSSHREAVLGNVEVEVSFAVWRAGGGRDWQKAGPIATGSARPDDRR